MKIIIGFTCFLLLLWSCKPEPVACSECGSNECWSDSECTPWNYCECHINKFGVGRCIEK